MGRQWKRIGNRTAGHPLEDKIYKLTLLKRRMERLLRRAELASKKAEITIELLLLVQLLKVKTNTKIMILEYKQTILEQISRAPRELANMLKRNLEVYEPLLKGLDQAVMQLEEKILGLEEQLQGLEKIQC